MPLSVGSLVPIEHNVAWAEAYLHAMSHPNPSNHLATIHQRFTQTGQTMTDRQQSDIIGGPFYKRSPKTDLRHSCTVKETCLVISGQLGKLFIRPTRLQRRRNVTHNISESDNTDVQNSIPTSRY